MTLPGPAPRALLITGGRVIDPAQGVDRYADLLIRDGRVAWLGAPGDGPAADGPLDRLNATGLVVAPGFIDIHTHLREPGLEYKETIAAGTLAAARGGFTTVCAMPNTAPVMDTAAVLEFVLRTAAREGAVKVLPIGAVTKGQKGEELAELGEMADAGAVAFSDDGRPVANAMLMRRALEYSLALGCPIIDHCEEPSLAKGASMHEGWVSSRLGIRGAPGSAEEIMVARNLLLAEAAGARVHIAHLSTARSVELVREAKARGVRVTAEATPHHLTLTDERVAGPGRGLLFSWEQPTGAGLLEAFDTNAKVNPPLRPRSDVEAVIAGLADGTIDAIATDHAPHATEDKLVEFDQAAMGISGLETALGAALSLVHAGRLDLPTLIERLTAGPRRVMGEGPRRRASARSPIVPECSAGTLAVGSPGDVVLFDPERAWTVNPAAFASKGKNSPLAGCTLRGKVMATIVDGRAAYLDPELQDGELSDV
ncbi:MAG: dihydroorotase [Chloroflexi bacterium]|nr:dihydroorotase [Chloroflexota bacterium]